MSVSQDRTANCPQCGSAANARYRVADLNRRVSKEKFQYYQCGSCGLVFLEPLPADLARYYPPQYYELPPSREALSHNAQFERYKLDLITRHVGRGRLLEIGPATGGFCFLAKEAGFDVHAIEMDARCSEFLRTVVGIEVQNSNEEVAALQREAPADVIALWHVIEHLRDPWAMLDAVCAKVRPGGIAVIATPNPCAVQFGFWGGRWTHLDAPRHVVLVPPELLVGRMERRGMQLVQMTTSDPGGIGWNEFGWIFSFTNLSSAPWLKRPLRVLGRMARAMVRATEDQEGRGAAYTAIFRKAA